MKFILKINEPVEQSFKFKSCLCKQALGTVASSLISLCSGLTTGISSVMLPQLRADKTINYNPEHDSWIASILILSMIIGSLVCGQILDIYGRKATHIILGVPFIIGWIVIGCANSTSTILIGRFITGIPSGTNKAVSMVYIGEITNPQIRSAALFLPVIMTPIGILISHVVGYYVPWKLSSLICIIPAAISTIIFFFLKESPLWLIAKRRTEEGIKTFRWFRGTDDASEVELATVLQRQSVKPKMSAKETLNIVCTMAFIKPMLILMVVMSSIQMSGMNVLRFYSQDIFQLMFSGNNNTTPFTLTMTMDCIGVVLPIAFCMLRRFLPRRAAFLTCSFGVPVFLVGLVTCLMVGYKNNIWIPVSCLVMYICFSGILIAIGWTFVPELLPNTARGFGSGMSAAFSYLTLFVALKITPEIINSYGVPVLFTIFGISTLAGGIILCFVLPETNGKTLQSIEDEFNKNKVKKYDP